MVVVRSVYREEIRFAQNDGYDGSCPLDVVIREEILRFAQDHRL
jgi:hypothetical protein